MIYFTADQHYGHENIIKYCNRPFKDADEMNRTMIDNHNAVVRKNDIVYTVGDFALLNKENTKKIFDQLNGEQYLILGNHDRLKSNQFRDIGFRSVQKQRQVKEFGLIHFPDNVRRFTCGIWLVGHIHNNNDMDKRKGNRINVGVDVWDFKPVSIEQIRELISQNGK